MSAAKLSPALQGASPLASAILNPIAGTLHEVGSLVLFLKLILRTAFTTSGNTPAVLEQILSICQRSLATVTFAGTFVGAIIVLQFNAVLLVYDAQIFLGGLNTSAIVREIGPLMITFILAGKIGAFTAAELGTMRVTEQIDAVECLGTNPVQYLVLPRFLGIVISSLILLALGIMISMVGSTFVATVLCGMNPLQYMSTITRFVGGWTLFCGAAKSLVYGVIVGGVACHKGYTARGGARGVGTAVTQAALYMSLFVILANYFTSNALNWIYDFLGAALGWVNG
jgi:phospholipid/cholesterol/gamma-HCH transport system permease protein